MWWSYGSGTVLSAKLNPESDQRFCRCRYAGTNGSGAFEMVLRDVSWECPMEVRMTSMRVYALCLVLLTL